MKKGPKQFTSIPATPATIPSKEVMPAKAIKQSSIKTQVEMPVAAPKIKAPARVAKPVVKAIAHASPTIISAQVDVGFGNTLYIRGTGPGLSWEKGMPLDCVDDDKWSISLSNVVKPVVFKFLVNDLTWSTSDDYTIQPGDSGVFTPIF